MTRKSHKKSKNGCTECKRRHLKCDETHPICIKCSTSVRKCSYAQFGERNGVFDGSRPLMVDGLSSSATDSSSASTPVNFSACNPVPIPCHVSARNVEVNLDHLELLDHFRSETCQTLIDNEDKIHVYRQKAISYGFKQPFLMYGLLALSALHLSLVRLERAKFYRTMATALQSKALTLFNNALPQVDRLDYLGVLMFSHITAVHVFCDIFNPVRGHFDAFLNRLVECVKLLRGIRVARSMLSDSLGTHDLPELLSETLEPYIGSSSLNEEFDTLRDLLSVADMSKSSIEVCKTSLDSLQQFYHWEDEIDRPSSSTYKLFAWLVTVSDGYTDLLIQRRPEALVLLAWYSILLFQRRNSWVVGKAGSYLFNSIQRHLGKHWERWLAWPNAIINS